MGEDIIEFDGIRDTMQGIIKVIGVGGGGCNAVRNQTVVLLEAMKMENNIEADTAGTVKEVKVRKGDSVLEGDVLVVIG